LQSRPIRCSIEEMPTKAQEQRMMTARANQAANKKRKSKKAKGRTSPLAGQPVKPTGARTRSKAAAQSTLDRNRSKHAERRGGAVLEESATGRPSRKSTRGSIDRTKRTTNQQLRAIAKVTSPSNRARSRR